MLGKIIIHDILCKYALSNRKHNHNNDYKISMSEQKGHIFIDISFEDYGHSVSFFINIIDEYCFNILYESYIEYVPYSDSSFDIFPECGLMCGSRNSLNKLFKIIRESKKSLYMFQLCIYRKVDSKDIRYKINSYLMAPNE